MHKRTHGAPRNACRCGARCEGRGKGRNHTLFLSAVRVMPLHRLAHNGGRQLGLKRCQVSIVQAQQPDALVRGLREQQQIDRLIWQTLV